MSFILLRPLEHYLELKERRYDTLENGSCINSHVLLLSFSLKQRGMFSFVMELEVGNKAGWP